MAWNPLSYTLLILSSTTVAIGWSSLLCVACYSSCREISDRRPRRDASRSDRAHAAHPFRAVRHIARIASVDVNQAKNRMQALGLLDRSFKAATADELTAAIEVLDDDHREGLESFVDDFSVDRLRDAVKAGRINGEMEAIAAIISDTCLADCIKELGDHADNPSTDQLKEVLPGLAERHGVAVTRIMLAATVAGEAPASAIIRDLLKHDELIALPKVDEITIAPLIDTQTRSDAEQAEVRAKHAEARKAKQEAERARRAQSAAARKRS